MKAIAFCGLACCVCSKNKGCVGCQDGGCESHGWCKNYNCCKEKGLNGRWECSEFPFTGCMPVSYTHLALELLNFYIILA